MLESELFALLEHTDDAAYCVSDAGEIRSWNRAAERLFGYSADDVLGHDIDEVFEARDALGTDALARGLEAPARRRSMTSPGIPNFDLEVRTRSGTRIWINVSTIVFDNRRTGQTIFARLARDIMHRHRNEELVGRVRDVARQLVTLTTNVADHSPVEPLSRQERRVLTLFAEGKSPATIARSLRITGQTLRNHLHHINRKLRTHNRLEAVTHALRRGLIE